MFRTPTLVVLFALTTLAAPVWAETTLNANDLPGATVTAPAVFEGFEILARADKSVVIEPLDEGRTAADGEVFNARIKLGGSGGPEFRALRFTAAATQLVVYCNSSSKTDARTLRVADEAGAVIADLVAPADGVPGVVTCEVPAGTFLVYSTSGGVNLYQITLK